MTSSDVRDILDIRVDQPKTKTKASIINEGQKKKSKTKQTAFKKPEGMHRELYALLYHDNRDKPPLLPTDTLQTYQTAKAKLSCTIVRLWKWMPFSNPARTDGAVFYHWRRAEDEGKDYSFAKFNRKIQIPVYSEQEYHQFLSKDGWSPEETQHLLDLCKRFDLRWHVVFDRYEHVKFPRDKPRSLEDLKERYYDICNSLGRVRKQPGEDFEEVVYDADHERRRRQQLARLFARTEEQVEEEAMLIQELKRIEARKKEREKKSQDLQKLIAFDSGPEGLRRVDRKSTKKRFSGGVYKKDGSTNEHRGSDSMYGIKFPDYKSSGVMLRSQMMKLPTSVNQKKAKFLEMLISDLKVDTHPMPSEEVVKVFNKLRSDIVCLYDLKIAYANDEMELQTLQYKWDALAPGHLPPVNNSKKVANVSKINSDSKTNVSGKTNPISDQMITVDSPVDSG